MKNQRGPVNPKLSLTIQLMNNLGTLTRTQIYDTIVVDQYLDAVMDLTANDARLTIPYSTKKSEADFSLTLLKLLFIGLVTQLIYVIYIVAFPLISNTLAGGPAADLEILMREYRWFAPVYGLGILLLYYLFWQAMQLIFAINEGRLNAAQPSFHFRQVGFEIVLAPVSVLKLLILTFGSLFGFTLVWLYPITANDLFRYVLRGRIWAIYGESPMLLPPNAFANDPYIAFAGEFGDWVSGYGPLWEIFVQVPLQLGATEMLAGTISLKFVVLLCYLLSAILIGWLALPETSSALAALLFFAWNPLILMQIPGNGHNDMLFMLLLIIGIIFWQRNVWWATALFFTLATLAKAPALLLLPLFGVVLLRNQPTWPERLAKGTGAVLIGLATAYLVYSVLGPVLDTLQGVSAMLTTRRGFAIASGIRMVLREVLPRGAEQAISPGSIWGLVSLQQLIPCQEAGLLTKIFSQIVPCQVAEALPRTTARHIFILFYGWLLIQLWRNKLNLVTAAFLAYFSQLMLGRTFRIWYPAWLIPFAALHLTAATFWRTLLFGLTAELSIINYFVVWRWWLRDWPWERLGLLTQLYYWPVMHLLTVPWLFGIPLFGPILLKWWGNKRLSLKTLSSY